LTLETSLPDGCTQTNVPSEFTFPGTNPFDAATFGISYGVDPFQYGFTLQSLVDFTSTVTCPGEDPVVTENQGFPLGVVGNGAFVTPDDVTISGSFDDGGVSGTFSFTRL
jgi:hypothetical protein